MATGGDVNDVIQVDAVPDNDPPEGDLPEGPVNPGCPSSSTHQKNCDCQPSPLTSTQTAQPIWQDMEYEKYVYLIGDDELREDNIDILIINSEGDRMAAHNFKRKLENQKFLLGIPDTANAEYPRVKLLEEIICGSKDNLDLAFSKALFVFLYVTKEFCDDTWTTLQGQACLKEAIEDKDRRWSVIPVHTKSKKSRAYKLPMVLNSLRPINYFDDGENHYIHVQKLLQSKVGLRLKRDQKLEERRKAYLDKHGHELIKDIKWRSEPSLKNGTPAPQKSNQTQYKEEKASLQTQMQMLELSQTRSSSAQNPYHSETANLQTTNDHLTDRLKYTARPETNDDGDDDSGHGTPPDENVPALCRLDLPQRDESSFGSIWIDGASSESSALAGGSQLLSPDSVLNNEIYTSPTEGFPECTDPCSLNSE